QRLLVRARQRWIRGACDVERAEAVVGCLARVRAVRCLAQQKGEPLRRLARVAGVQPAARVEEEDLPAMARAGGILDGSARVCERGDVGAPAAVDRELCEEIEPVPGADARRR